MNTKSNQLIEDYRKGDETALPQLVQLHLVPLYNFVLLLVREKDAAEDVVQETFIKMWKNLSRFDTEKKFKTWLYAIAKNTAFDALKKKKALPFSFFEDTEGNNTFDNTANIQPEILEELTSQEEIEALEVALLELPLLYRTLLILVYREDFDLHEAAEILETPYNTIKSRHQRGIIKLKEIFAQKHASKNDNQSY